MEILTFFVVLVTFLIVIVNNSRLNQKINSLLSEMNSLKSMLRESEKTTFTSGTGKPAEVQPNTVADLLMREDSKEHTYPETMKEEISTFDIRQPLEKPVLPTQPRHNPKFAWPSDIEKFIGENLISKIGIIILVFGVAFFVKYAINRNWINEYGRTSIGMLSGFALIATAHFIRKSYKTFSSLLTGGGFAVFYLTIAIAFHQYHIFSELSAFICLVVVTIFSVIMSLVYDRKELAIFSQLGGYAAPFLVSSGDESYVVLFVYVLILNFGLLALAYFKRWNILNIIAFIFTILIFWGWQINTFWWKGNHPFAGAFAFATSFYLIFFLVNILNNLKENNRFKGNEIIMILTDNLFYFVSGVAILSSYHSGIFKGLFTLTIGVFNFMWLLYLYRKKQIDKNLKYILAGLVITFISLAIPIQLKGNAITLFWTGETVLLLWLWQKSRIPVLLISHFIILMLTVVSLIMNEGIIYANAYDLPVVLNHAFVTGFTVITGIALSTFFLRKETTWPVRYLDVNNYRNLLLFGLFTAAYLVPFFELQYQMKNYFGDFTFRQSVYWTYNYLYLLSGILISGKIKWEDAQKWFFVISCAGLFVYFSYYHILVLHLRDNAFFSHYSGQFLFHYLTIPLVSGIVVSLFKYRTRFISGRPFLSKAFLWFICFFVIFLLSTEMDNVVFLFLPAGQTTETFASYLEINHKAGYPILWGVSAFVLILWGMKGKNKDYRIMALSLLALIILKLFLFDVWQMNEGGRITAFIFLGIILLTVSFLYQKLRKFFLSDNSTLHL